MQFGFNLPNSGKLAEPEIMLRIAREGEVLGYDYLTVTDHIALPDMAEPGYPYSESGAFYSLDSAHRHEMLTLAAWLAAATPRDSARSNSSSDIASGSGTISREQSTSSTVTRPECRSPTTGSRPRSASRCCTTSRRGRRRTARSRRR